MTPTADLMKLVEELSEVAEMEYKAECCNSDFPINRVQRLFAEAAAALTASCDARVGGEVVAWRWPGGHWQDGGPSQRERDELFRAGKEPEYAYALATPAQPKASTYDDFVRLAKDPNRRKASEPFQQTDECGRPMTYWGGLAKERVAAQPKASEDAESEIYGWVSPRHGHFFKPAEVAATERNRQAIERGDLVRVYLHPKASEGKAGGEDAK